MNLSNLWGHFFRIIDYQITVFESVVFSQQQIAEKLLKVADFRFNIFLGNYRKRELLLTIQVHR